MARTYSEVPEPRYVERAKFSDNGGGSGGDNIVIVPFVLNDEDPTLSYLDITAKELFELFQAKKIIYAQGTNTYSEPGYSEIEYSSWQIPSALKMVTELPEEQISYEFQVYEGTTHVVFSANADDEKPTMQGG